MSNCNNQIPDSNHSYQTPRTPFSLEGQWQPWYDDRRDYNTNAPTYYDYLSNFNGLISSLVEFVNEIARRDITVEDSDTVELIKNASWFTDELNEIILKANVKVSGSADNAVTVRKDGIYVKSASVDDLKAKIAELQSNYEALKTRVDLLDGSGWATKEQLEELRKIIEANKDDYENADSGLRLIIANMQKRLDALDGLSSEIDTWNEKVKKLEAESLNVKNIATLAGTLAGATTSAGYTNVPIAKTAQVATADRFVLVYNSFTQRINGRITRLERFGFDYSGFSTASGIDPVKWTKIGIFSLDKFKETYKSSPSNNMLNIIAQYAIRYFNNYFIFPQNAFTYPFIIRLDFDKGTKYFNVYSRSLPTIGTKGDVFKATTEELYTITTWLDDSGNEYLPSFNEDGTPKDLSQCTPVESLPATISEESNIVEHEGKFYFKDEFEVGNLNHPIDESEVTNE